MSGVSGVKAHQTMLDVTGNNIANVNTTGFKKSVTIFQDLLYQDSRGASTPNEEKGYGGTNPMQVGSGVKVGAIETIHSQGNLQYTGSRNDMMIQGDGYYVLKEGTSSVYSRAGNFGLDGSSNMVQSGTGYMVQGYSMTQDPNDPTRYIQGTTLQDINIPVGQKLPAKETSLVGYRCNLDARVPSYLPTGLTIQGTTQTTVMGGTEYEITFEEEDGGATVAGVGRDFVTMTFTNPAGAPTPLTMYMDSIDANGVPQLVFDQPSASGTPVHQLSGVDALFGGTDVTTYDPATGLLIIQDGADKWELNVLDTLDLEYMSFKDPNDPTRTWKVLTDFDNMQSTESDFKLWYVSSDTPANTVNVMSTRLATPPNPLYFNKDGTFRDYCEDSSVAPVIPSFQLSDGGGNDLNVFLQASSAGRALQIQASDNQAGVPAAGDAPTEDVLATLNQRLTSVHATKVDIYDSLGNAHTLEVSWERLELENPDSGNGQWRWRAWFPEDKDSFIPLSPASGIITFDKNGMIKGSDVFTLEAQFSAIGADNADIKLDFSGRSFNEEPIEGVTQFGSASTTKAYYQDGYAMGVLQDYSVGPDGTITGVYSNEQRRPLSTIALALFANPEGLQKVGDTAFRSTSNSGLAQVVSPQSGGAGKILGGNLEMSNVDLTEEFVTLIKAQRGFQASVRAVTTSDSVLEELVNIKR
jgi:flagellar hook protein FlgE